MKAGDDFDSVGIEPLIVDGIGEARDQGAPNVPVDTRKGVWMCFNERLDDAHSLPEFTTQSDALSFVPPPRLRDIAAGREPVDELHRSLLRFA